MFEEVNKQVKEFNRVVNNMLGRFNEGEILVIRNTKFRVMKISKNQLILKRISKKEKSDFVKRVTKNANTKTTK